MQLTSRVLTKEDYTTLVSWWKQHKEWQPVPRNMLPENGTGGLMIERNGKPLVAGFLYLTNSKVAWTEWIVGDPNQRGKKEATTLLIESLENIARDTGAEIILSIGRNETIKKIHRNLGYAVDDTPSYEISKNIK